MLRKKAETRGCVHGCSVYVCSVSVLVMDDGVLGYGSCIHTAAPPLTQGGGDCREMGLMWVKGAGCSSSLCAR